MRDSQFRMRFVNNMNRWVNCRVRIHLSFVLIRQRSGFRQERESSQFVFQIFDIIKFCLNAFDRFK